MKEAKKIEEIAAARANAIRKAWLDRTNANDQARRTLAQLQDWLLEHTKALSIRENRCTRLTPTVQQVVRSANTICIVTDETTLAAQLIAGKSLSAIILEEQRQPLLKRFHDSLRFTDGTPDIVNDPNDLVAFKEWDFERAAVQILKVAIKSQKKIAAATTEASMEKFSRTVAQARAETAREVLAGLAELRRIVEPDQALAKGLNPEEIEALRPKPFPLRLLSSEAVSWLLDAVEEKMIESEDLSGIELELEAVSTEDELQDVKKVSWLDRVV